jgi:hypothetical protein
MNVGDLVQDASDWRTAHGIVLAVKEKEYIIIKWFDTGEEVCYDMPPGGHAVHDWLEVISENR